MPKIPANTPSYADDENRVLAPRDYQDFDPESAFTITGHLFSPTAGGNETPLEARVRVVSRRVFPSVQLALEWAIEKFGKVYRDVSREEWGMWGFVVPKPSGRSAQ